MPGSLCDRGSSSGGAGAGWGGRCPGGVRDPELSLKRRGGALAGGAAAGRLPPLGTRRLSSGKQGATQGGQPSSRWQLRAAVGAPRGGGASGAEQE